MARLADFDAMGRADYWFAAEDVILPGPAVDGSVRGSIVEYTTDGGRKWGASQQFRTGDGIEMSIVTPKVGYLLGGPKLYETTDGGSRWRVVGAAPVQGPGGTGDLVFASREDGWAVSWEEGLDRTTDAGTAWARVALPAPPSYRHFSMTIGSPRFFTPDDGVLPVRFDDTDDGAQPIVVYLTHDGGEHWAAVAAPPDPDTGLPQEGFPADDFSAVSMTDRVLYVGPKLYETADAGRTWSSTVPTPAWTATKILGIGFWSLKDGWLDVLDNTCGPKLAAQLGPACVDPVLVRTANGGQTWTGVTQ